MDKKELEINIAVEIAKKKHKEGDLIKANEILMFLLIFKL